jgi:hypothetical protein
MSFIKRWFGSDKENRRACFSEIELLLNTFYNCYSQDNRLNYPLYGLIDLIDSLKKNEKVNIEYIKSFVKCLSHYETDIQFSTHIKKYVKMEEGLSICNLLE